MTPATSPKTISPEAQLAIVLEQCGDDRIVHLATTLAQGHRRVLEHGAAVAAIAVAMARRAGMAAGRRPLLARAALLHDIGKRYVPWTVLDKPGGLVPHERQVVEAHSTVGAAMLLEAGLVEEAAIIRHHHERWDGAGYPDRLYGTAIPYESRLIFVADVFDAMTSDRPYRLALAPDVALAEIAAEAGAQLDPAAAQLLPEVL
jgi:putative nucleotidyltransferase with HDIG domain